MASITYSDTHTYKHTDTYTRMHIHTNTHTYTQIHTHTHKYTHTDITNTHIHTQIYAHTTQYDNFKSQNICEIKTSAINMIWRTEGEQVIISSHTILIIALTYNIIITAICPVRNLLVY